MIKNTLKPIQTLANKIQQELKRRKYITASWISPGMQHQKNLFFTITMEKYLFYQFKSRKKLTGFNNSWLH